MKHSTLFFAGLGLLVLSTTSNAELIKGKVSNSQGIVVPYVYETHSNSFALDVRPLQDIKATRLEYSPVEKPICARFSAIADTAPDSLSPDLIGYTQAPSSLALRVQILKPYQTAEYSKLVQADIKRRGQSLSLPRNVTQLEIRNLKLTLVWSSSARTPKSKYQLQQRTQAALVDAWSPLQDDSGLQAGTQLSAALATTLCDLQDRSLTFALEYEIASSFVYSEDTGVPVDSLLRISQRLKDSASWIDSVAVQSEQLSPREARLVGAASLLAKELVMAAPQSSLLEPDSFIKIFNSMINTPTAEVRRYFDTNAAQDLADSLGDRQELQFNPLKGTSSL